MFFVAVFVSYAFALLFSLAFEMPVMHIDKMLFGGGEKKPKKRRNNNSSSKNTDQPAVADKIFSSALDNEEKRKHISGIEIQLPSTPPPASTTTSGSSGNAAVDSPPEKRSLRHENKSRDKEKDITEALLD